jgi:hypothetical protein
MSESDLFLYFEGQKAKANLFSLAQADTPRIGIGWFLKEDNTVKVVFTYTEFIRDAEEIGDFIFSRYQHPDIWSNLQENGTVPESCSYIYLPRFRVGYNNRDGKYYGFAGNWLTEECKSLILSRFKLPSQATSWEINDHYHDFSSWALPAR